MPDKNIPGVYIEEGSLDKSTICGVDTCTLGMLGLTEKGPSEVSLVSSFREYCTIYGGYLHNSYLTYAVKGFFLNGGKRCFIGRIEASSKNGLVAKDFIGDPYPDDPMEKLSGLAAFRTIDEINIVYVPDLNKLSKNEAATLIFAIKDHCEQLKRFAILDIAKNQQRPSLIERPVDSSYVAVYYPWLKVIDPVSSLPILIPPGGHVAGIYARTDITRGVHKAPANEIIKGALEPEHPFTTTQQDTLNPKGINVIRQFPGRGIVVWGARTCTSDPEWKYISVRRFIIYLENSIVKGTNWVVFEPNNEHLWSRLIRCITNFLYEVWRSGGLVGTNPKEAFFVRCDHTTMTQDDIDRGSLICMIGVATSRPAEFAILRHQYLTAND